ncbi:MAG: S49 family peptidase [Chloroflexota bacterium]
MAANENISRSPLRLILAILFLLIVPLALGLYLAPKLVPQPQVGIIRLSEDIFSRSTYEVIDQLTYARNDPAIKAVVLVINSPGGSASHSEELFLAVLNARQDMPVVASVDVVAASGAYYMAAAADEIYAKPTSFVGSVGVIASLPGDVFIEDDILTSGPYKGFGGTRDSTVRQIERAKFSFLEAVRVGRGERLNMGLDVLSRAEVYSGVQALEFGLVDGLYSTDEAIQRAANLAGLSNYRVAELYPLALGDGETTVGRYQPPPLDLEQLWSVPTSLPTGIYYRYMAPTQR